MTEDQRPECEHCGERTNRWNLSWRDWCSDCESESARTTNDEHGADAHAGSAVAQADRVSAVDRAIQARLAYLRRELEIAERSAERELLRVDLIADAQRAPFEAANAEIKAARVAVPLIRAEIAELEGSP